MKLRLKDFGRREDYTDRVFFDNAKNGGETAYVAIKGAKGSLDREMLVPPFIMTLLDRCIVERDLKPNDKLFPFSYQVAYKEFKKFTVSGKGLHALRHTFAVRLYKKSQNIKLVQAMLGHKNIQNTLIYLRCVDTEKAMRREMPNTWSKYY